jgi:hypothetical protein
VGLFDLGIEVCFMILVVFTFFFIIGVLGYGVWVFLVENIIENIFGILYLI